MNLLHGVIVGLENPLLVLGAEMSLKCGMNRFRRQDFQKLLEAYCFGEIQVRLAGLRLALCNCDVHALQSH